MIGMPNSSNVFIGRGDENMPWHLRVSVVSFFRQLTDLPTNVWKSKK